MSTTDPISIVNRLINAGACPETCGRATEFCKHLRTPVWLTGLMVSMLRQWFGSRERLSIEKARFLWHKEVGKSEVYIADDFNWDFINVQQRPAIVVELDSFSAGEDIESIGRSGMVSWNREHDELNFASIENGRFNIHCIAKQKLEAWALAWEVKMFLATYSDVIKEAYGFKKWKVAGVQKPQPMKEAEEYKAAAVVLQFNMIDAWALKRESLKVQTIDPHLIISGGGEIVEFNTP